MFENNESNTGHEGRAFTRVDVPMFSSIEATVGPLGKPPTPGTPLNISRGGTQMRTGVDFFAGAEGTECIIRFADPDRRLIPDRALARVKRVEEHEGYYLVALEFSHPLEKIGM